MQNKKKKKKNNEISHMKTWHHCEFKGQMSAHSQLHVAVGRTKCCISLVFPLDLFDRKKTQHTMRCTTRSRIVETSQNPEFREAETQRLCKRHVTVGGEPELQFWTFCWIIQWVSVKSNKAAFAEYKKELWQTFWRRQSNIKKSAIKVVPPSKAHVHVWQHNASFGKPWAAIPCSLWWVQHNRVNSTKKRQHTTSGKSAAIPCATNTNGAIRWSWSERDRKKNMNHIRVKWFR